MCAANETRKKIQRKGEREGDGGEKRPDRLSKVGVDEGWTNG